MTCSGDPNARCGGVYKMSLFQNPNLLSALISSSSSTSSSRTSSAVATASSSTHPDNNVSLKHNNTAVIVGVVVGVLGAIAIVGVAVLLLRRRKRSRDRSAAFVASSYPKSGRGTDGGGPWTEAYGGGNDADMNTSVEKMVPMGAFPLATLAHDPRSALMPAPRSPPTTIPSVSSSQSHSGQHVPPLSTDTNPFLTPDPTPASNNGSIVQLGAPLSSSTSSQPSSGPPMSRQTSLKRKPVPQLLEAFDIEALTSEGATLGPGKVRQPSVPGEGLRRVPSSDGKSLLKGMLELDVDHPSEEMR